LVELVKKVEATKITSMADFSRKNEREKSYGTDCKVTKDV